MWNDTVDADFYLLRRNRDLLAFKNQDPVGISMDGRARSLYLHSKPLVHPVNGNKNCSQWVSAPIFVNKGNVWCSYCNLVNKYKKLLKTRDLNPILSICM